MALKTESALMRRSRGVDELIRVIQQATQSTHQDLTEEEMDKVKQD
jgi:hypothetical protein